MQQICHTSLFSKRVFFPLLALVSSIGIYAQEGASVYERSIRSVVTIEGKMSSGSGFLVAPQVVATNYHVVSGLLEAACYIEQEDTRYQIDGFLAADKINDLVLLKVSALKEKPLPLSTYSVRPGQRIYVIGSPQGLEGTIAEGLVSSLRTDDGVQQMQISAPISHGSSGGPVLNVSGEVVGISVSGLEEGENLNFAIPVEKLKQLLSGLSKNVQDLSSLPPMDRDEEDVSETFDMGKAELIYDMGLSEKASPLTLDYIAYFRDSTCFYFTYDMTEAYESDTLSEYWLSDHRIIDINNGEVVKALHSNLLGTENDPHRVYRGTTLFYSITFPRLSPSIRNFHLLEGNCEEENYCFRNIRLRDHKTVDGMDWETYENASGEGTVSFFTSMKNMQFKVTIGSVTLGSVTQTWKGKTKMPGCGDGGNSVLTVRLPVGKHTFLASTEDTIIRQEIEVTREGCLVVNLDY